MFRPAPPVPLGFLLSIPLLACNDAPGAGWGFKSWLPCGAGSTSPTPVTIRLVPDAPLQPLLGGWRPDGLSASCDSSDCVYCVALARLRQPGGSGACWLRQKRSRSCTDLAGLGEGERPAATSSWPAEEPCALARVPSATTLAAVVPDAMSDSLWDHALLAEVPSAGWSQETQQPGPPQLKRQRLRDQRHDTTAGAGQAAATSSQQPCSSSSSSEGSSASEGSSSRGGRASSARSHGSSSAAAAAAVSGSLPAAASAWHPSWQAPAALREVASFLPPAHHHRSRPGSSCCTDIVCALEFEEHGWLLASAGVSKQVHTGWAAASLAVLPCLAVIWWHAVAAVAARV